MSWLPPVLPERVEIDDLVFVPLTPDLLRDDYAAVMRDVPMLRAWSGQDWPTPDFTIEDDLLDLQRHHQEQRAGVALTFSVLVDAVVQGCIYVRPFIDALRTRAIEPPEGSTVPLTDAVVRGWLHERPAVDLIRASLTWLGRAPFDFSRIWWQANSDVPDQLLGCDRLGLSTVIRIGQTPIWELRS